MKNLLLLFLGLTLCFMTYGQQSNTDLLHTSHQRTPNAGGTQIDVDATGTGLILSGQNTTPTFLTLSQMWSDDSLNSLVYGIANSAFSPFGPISALGSYVLATDDLSIGHNNATKINFLHFDESNDNLGIGTATPEPVAKLHVQTPLNEAARFGSSTDANQNSWIALAHGANRVGTLWAIGSSMKLRSDNGSVAIQTNGNNDRVTVLSTGEVGINTTIPGAQLEVNSGNSYFKSNEIYVGECTPVSNSWTNGHFQTISTGNGGGIKIQATDSGFGAADGGQLSIASGSTPDFRIINWEAGPIIMYPDGHDLSAEFDGSAATYQLTVYGDALASGGSLVPSDVQLKSDIVNLENALSKVMRLSPKTYNYNYKDPLLAYLNLPSEPQIGLIAQELEVVVPELVKTNNLSTTKLVGDSGVGLPDIEKMDGLRAINYVGLVPVLVGAIQEQQQIISDQNNTIQNLIDRVEALEARD